MTTEKQNYVDDATTKNKKNILGVRQQIMNTF